MAITLLATVPLGLSVLTVLLDLLHAAPSSAGPSATRVRLRDYVGLVLGAYPFQLVLSAAAVWATARFALRPQRLGEDRATAAPTSSRQPAPEPALAEEAA